MTGGQWQIPPSVLKHLARVPPDRAVVVLLRHSVRDDLPPGEVGYAQPITEVGRLLATALGEILRGRLRTLHASPLPRCMQTAEALAKGAQADLQVVPDRHLGDPGVFVLDARQAWTSWRDLGHVEVMRHLVAEVAALPGMAKPDEAARFLVQHMLGAAADRPGVHVFVTHDSLVTATAARLLGLQLGSDDWPWYLEGAFFWHDDAGVHTVYRGHEAQRANALCSFAAADVIEFARREISATIGLHSGARFFLAGGAYKSLLTGRPPRDLDLWAPSDHDRDLLLASLRTCGACPAAPRLFSVAFEVAGRLVDVPHKVEPSTLADRLGRFDIGLSAVGVEHRPDGEWSALVHPLALESARRRQVLLLTPLVNPKYALVTLERMRRYAHELGFEVPASEEDRIWAIFEAQPPEGRQGMIDRFERTARCDQRVEEDLRDRGAKT
ncbi:MAG: histidine phosphatase family protein [Myxococcales bacterium]|nr:histidine phosphatase family protein [Myxococcales bacterium]